MKTLCIFCLISILCTSCKKKKDSNVCDICPEATDITFHFESFANGDSIPWRFTCKNQNQNFPGFAVKISGESIKSCALIMDDPDAVPVVGKTWNHWTLYNIRALEIEIFEGNAIDGPLPEGTFRGTTSFGDTAYGGPCPPVGQKHTYVFTIYGLDLPDLGLPRSATSAQVRMAMKGHILDSSVYKGTFAR